MEKIIGLTLDRTQSLLEDDVHHDTENRDISTSITKLANLVQVLPFQRHISEINLHLKVKSAEIIGEKITNLQLPLAELPLLLQVLLQPEHKISKQRKRSRDLPCFR